MTTTKHKERKDFVIFVFFVVQYQDWNRRTMAERGNDHHEDHEAHEELECLYDFLFE